MTRPTWQREAAVKVALTLGVETAARMSGIPRSTICTWRCRYELANGVVRHKESAAAPPIAHLRATYFLPSWQGGDIEHGACQRFVFGAPQRRIWRFAPDDQPSAVTCPGCRQALGLSDLKRAAA